MMNRFVILILGGLNEMMYAEHLAQGWEHNEYL